jgi:hypothetical protein
VFNLLGLLGLAVALALVWYLYDSPQFGNVLAKARQEQNH